MVQQNSQAEEPKSESSFAMKQLSTTMPTVDIPIDNIISVQPDHLDDTVSLDQSPTLSTSIPIAITSMTAPTSMDLCENSNNESPDKSIQSFENDVAQIDLNVTAMDLSSTELITMPVSTHSPVDKIIGPTLPTTPNVPKERRKRIIIDDDDESPTFNPLRCHKKARGKNRRNLLSKKQRKTQLLSPSDKANENAVFTSPEGIVSIALLVLLIC